MARWTRARPTTRTPASTPSWLGCGWSRSRCGCGSGASRSARQPSSRGHRGGEFAPFPEYEPAEASRWLAAAVEAAWSGWPDARRDRIPVNATVPAVQADEVAGVLGGFDGCETAKVKVAEPGQASADDVARVAAVRDAMGPSAHIRVDANGAWDVDQASDALAASRHTASSMRSSPARPWPS